MTTQAIPSSLLVNLPMMALLVAGCTDPDTKNPNSEICTQLKNENCDETGGDETAGDETAGEEGPYALGPDECYHNHGSSLVGIQYQCVGELHVRMDFSLGGDSCVDLLGSGWCQQAHYFDNTTAPYAAAEE